MFELLQKMLGIQQNQIIVIIEGGITVVGKEGILISIPQEDMQIMNSSIMRTSFVRFRRVPQLYLCVLKYCICMRIYVSKESKVSLLDNFVHKHKQYDYILPSR